MVCKAAGINFLKFVLVFKSNVKKLKCALEEFPNQIYQRCHLKILRITPTYYEHETIANATEILMVVRSVQQIVMHYFIQSLLKIIAE